MALFVASSLTETQVSVGLVVGALLTLALLANALMSILDRFLPKTDKFFSRAEGEDLKKHLEDVERRSNERWKTNKEAIDAGDKRLEADLASMEARLTDRITTNLRNSDTRFAELLTKIDAANTTMATLSNDVMRTIGRLEGAREEARRALQASDPRAAS